jgi:hypothetical protein
MEGLQFSRDEVEALAGKLDALQHVLLPDERALLVAIFSVARENVLPVAKHPVEAEPTAADLRQQILDAFLPADGSTFVMIPARISGDPLEHG